MTTALEHDDILVLSDGTWTGAKRARHKVPLAWARAGNRVLWVETDIRAAGLGASWGPLAAVEPNLFVVSPPRLRRTHYPRARPWKRGREPLGRGVTAAVVRRGLALLEMRPRWIVVWQEPRLAPLLDWLPAATRIYYASDLYTGGSERHLLAACCRRCDLVFATSRGIAGSVAPYHDHVHVIPHAVDLEWWERAPRTEPPELASIPRPRCIFVGVATIKFDAELWTSLAERRPDWSFVTVGPVLDPVLRSDAFRRGQRLPNVHHLGAQPYPRLPAFLRHADRLAMPYVRDPVRIHSGLPNKFYEYLAAGRPILSTPFTEFEDRAPALQVLPDVGAWSEALDRGPDRWPVPDLWSHSYAARVKDQAAILERFTAAKRDER
jgi:glycosyltransferase involved in cell wall biosynthesis